MANETSPQHLGVNRCEMMKHNGARNEQQLRVLIVDDHDVVREGIATILAQRYPECLIAAASCYGEAINHIHDADWSLMITELAIPGRGGIELVREVVKLRKEMPVLVFTRHKEEEYGIRAIKSGAAGFVCKEAGSDILLHAVGQLLDGRRYVSNGLAQSLVSFVRRDEDGPPHEKLSDREFQVLSMIGKGSTIKEIAGECCLSVKTVSTYRARIQQKLGLKSLAEIVRYCLENSLV